MVDDHRPAPDASDPESTAALDRPDATKEMPPVDTEPERPRWTASAAVPVPGVRPEAESTDEYDIGPGPGDGGRSWTTPLLVALVATVLFGVLMAGLWLIFTGREGAGPGATTSSAPPLPSSSAPPPTSAPASSQPPSTPQAETFVPPVLGLSEAEARQRLTDAGLRVQATRRADASAGPGTVIDVSPGEGSTVAANSVVRIVIASAPPTTTPSPSTSGAL